MAEDKRTPARPPNRDAARPRSPGGEVEAFLAAARAVAPPSAEARGRLIFALDATMSRQPTWDAAMKLQSEMFEAVRQVGSLQVQLIYFRGFNECRASRWVSDARALRDLMTGISCRGGRTQIGRVLAHARKESGKQKVGALVYVGDALEEPIDDLAATAGELGMLGVRLFAFQEGNDAGVERGFRELARLTGGAWARFDPRAAGELAELLKAAAAYAVGGMKALGATPAARLLIGQMR